MGEAKWTHAQNQPSPEGGSEAGKGRAPGGLQGSWERSPAQAATAAGAPRMDGRNSGSEEMDPIG